MKKKLLIPLGLGAAGLVIYLILRATKAEAVTPELGFVEHVAEHYNPAISQSQASQIASSFVKWTKKRNVNVFTSLAIITQESHFRPSVTSPDDCRGLWQLGKEALAELERVYGIKTDFNRLYEIDYNMMLGTLYYLYCVELAEGDRREAIARYYRTTEYWKAWDYADEVLAKRAEITAMYEDFIKAPALY